MVRATISWLSTRTSPSIVVQRIRWVCPHLDSVPCYSGVCAVLLRQHRLARSADLRDRTWSGFAVGRRGLGHHAGSAQRHRAVNTVVAEAAKVLFRMLLNWPISGGFTRTRPNGRTYPDLRKRTIWHALIRTRSLSQGGGSGSNPVRGTHRGGLAAKRPAGRSETRGPGQLLITRRRPRVIVGFSPRFSH